MDRTDALSRLQASGRYALELEAVSKHFGALVALADINLAVRAGERRAILGSNGAGKTTLFNAITGDSPITTGCVRFFGEDVTDLPAHQRIRRGLRRTYQISQLFASLSVRDNVFLAARGVSPGRFSFRRPRPSDPRLEQADTLIEAVHLSDAAGTPVAELSYGQQRQLEIALALAGA
ncbi:MAG: ATP-binding cassette domain-containing protein, partial [Shimia sp.]